MRIKAICIRAPLSFPLPFIYPSVTPPEPIPSAHSPQQSTAPTWKTSLKGGGKKIYKNITSTHFTVIPLSSLSPWSFHSLPRPLVLFPSDLKTPQLPLFLHLSPTFCPVILHLIFHIRLHRNKRQHQSSVQILSMNDRMFYQNDLMWSCCCCCSSDIIINIAPGPSHNEHNSSLYFVRHSLPTCAKKIGKIHK